MKKGGALKIVILLTVAAALVLVQYFFDIAQYLDSGLLSALLARTGRWAPLVYMAIMALLVATPLPTLPLDLAAGAFFGPMLGTLYSVVGATGGALISFFLARFLGRKLIERFLKGHINFCTPCSDRLLTRIVFFARLVPVFSFDMISYGAGLTKMSTKNYILATFLGMVPLTFVYNTFGVLLVIGKWMSMLLGGIMVVLFFVLPWWVERYDLFSLRRFFVHPGMSPEENKTNKEEI